MVTMLNINGLSIWIENGQPHFRGRVGEVASPEEAQAEVGRMTALAEEWLEAMEAAAATDQRRRDVDELTPSEQNYVKRNLRLAKAKWRAKGMSAENISRKTSAEHVRLIAEVKLLRDFWDKEIDF